MKQELLDFLEWIEDNIEDIFEIVEEQESLVDRYLKDNY